MKILVTVAWYSENVNAFFISAWFEEMPAKKQIKEWIDLNSWEKVFGYKIMAVSKVTDEEYKRLTED